MFRPCWSWSCEWRSKRPTTFLSSPGVICKTHCASSNINTSFFLLHVGKYELRSAFIRKRTRKTNVIDNTQRKIEIFACVRVRVDVFGMSDGLGCRLDSHLRLRLLPSLSLTDFSHHRQKLVYYQLDVEFYLFITMLKIRNRNHTSYYTFLSNNSLVS